MNERTERHARSMVVLGDAGNGFRPMRRRCAALTAVTVIALSVTAVSGAEVLSPTAVLQAEYRDGATLTIFGSVVNARIWTAPSGVRYYRFHLTDGRVGLPILFAGPTRCPEQSAATVTGSYRPARVVKGRLFQQHVEARTIQCEETAGRVRAR